MNNSTTSGLLAELRQQDLLREAASGRLVAAGASAHLEQGLAAQIRRRLAGRILRSIRLVSPDARRAPGSQPDHLRREPGRA